MEQATAGEARPRVLFLCTGNSCRSQMAEGWTRALHGDTMDVYSAGVEVHGLNPLAVRVMAEAGVDISRQTSKHVDSLQDIHFDAVITVCDHAREACPLFPGTALVLHAGFPDPPAEARLLATQGADEEVQLDCYRRVRELIHDFVRTLPQVLVNGRTASSCP